MMSMMQVMTMLTIITLVTFYHPDGQGHWAIGTQGETENGSKAKQICTPFTGFTANDEAPFFGRFITPLICLPWSSQSHR